MKLAPKYLDWAVVGLFALLPIYLIRFNVAGLPLTVLEVAIILIVALGIFTKRYDWQKLKAQPVFWLSVVITLIATLSVGVSPNTIGALGIWKAYYIEPIALFALLLSIGNVQLFKKILVALGISAIAISIFGFWQYFSGYGVPVAFMQAGGGVDRIVSVYGYPNAIGLFLAPIVMLYSGWLFEKAQWKFQAAKIIVILISFAAIILAESEGAMLSIPALWLALLIWNQRTRLWAISASIIGAIVLLVTPALHAYILSKLLLQDYSGFIRRLIWKESWLMLLDHPIFGAGLAGYQTVIKPYHLPTFEIFLYPHNIVLNFWSELGILGLISFAILIGYHLWQSSKNALKRLEPHWLYLAAFAAMSQMVIHGLVDAPYLKNDLSVLFWLVVAMAFTISTLTPSQPSPVPGEGATNTN